MGGCGGALAVRAEGSGEEPKPAGGQDTPLEEAGTWVRTLTFLRWTEQV